MVPNPTPNSNHRLTNLFPLSLPSYQANKRSEPMNPRPNDRSLHPQAQKISFLRGTLSLSLLARVACTNSTQQHMPAVVTDAPLRDNLHAKPPPFTSKLLPGHQTVLNPLSEHEQDGSPSPLPDGTQFLKLSPPRNYSRQLSREMRLQRQMSPKMRLKTIWHARCRTECP